MAMKAVECTVDKREPVAGPAETPQVHTGKRHEPGNDDMDEVVMILVPKVTFNAMEELAKKHGGSVAQVMSVALKLLQMKSEEKDGA